MKKERMHTMLAPIPFIFKISKKLLFFGAFLMFCFSGFGQVTITISAPSPGTTSAGPVEYTVTYTGATSVTLAIGDITLNTTGTAIGTVGVSGTGTAIRIVTISGITGDGTLGITIAEDTAIPAAPVTPAVTSTTFIVDNTAPTAPSVLVASNITDTTVDLSWTASTDAVGVTDYLVYNNGTLLVATGSTATTYQVTGLAPSTAYNLTVRAVDAATNESGDSNAQAFSTLAAPDTTPPSVPTGLASSAITQTTFTLSWAASTDTEGTVSNYQVFQDGASIGFSGGALFLGVTGLAADTSYDFTVLAIDDSANPSAQSAPLNVTTTAAPDTTPPSVPTGLASSAITQTGFTLSWTASTDAVGVTGYTIFRDGTQIGTTTGATTFNLTGLTAGTTYSMRVSAQDLADNTSAQSAALNVTTTAAPDTTPPTVPTGLASSAITQTSFTLTWTASTDAVGVTGYTILQDGSPIGTTTGATTFNVTGLTAGTTYSMRVSAQDLAGNTSAQSTPLNVTTTAAPDTTPPTVPTGLASSAITQTGFTLTWAPSTDDVGVTDYEVFRNAVSIGLTGGVTTLNVTGLTASTAYAFTVRALDAVPNASAQSAPLNVTTLAPPVISMDVGVTLAEGNSGATAFVFTVNRTGDTSGTASASYAITGSGTNPANAVDFSSGILPSGTANFLTGSAITSITVKRERRHCYRAERNLYRDLERPERRCDDRHGHSLEYNNKR